MNSSNSSLVSQLGNLFVALSLAVSMEVCGNLVLNESGPGHKKDWEWLLLDMQIMKMVHTKYNIGAFMLIQLASNFSQC